MTSLDSSHSRKARRAHQPFPARRLVVWPAFLALASAGCSGGGGGSGDSTPPTIVAASFLGSGVTPNVGDTLRLTFAEGMTDVTGSTVGDAEFALSGGGTLGSATTVQSQPTATTMVLLLGAGASFTAGATTLDFASGNATVKDTAGNAGDPGTAVTIDDSDGAAPTISNVTVAAIDDLLNGDGPAGGTLQVPQNGFPIDLTFADTGSPGAASGVDVASTQITASVAVLVNGLSRAAGTNLTPFLTAGTATSTTARFSVPTTVVLPVGPLVFSVVVVDGGGLSSSAATYDVTVRGFTDALRPFETTANVQQVWWIDLSRDLESYSTLNSAGVISIEVTSGASGRADFLDLLHVMGLQTTTPQTNGSTDSNIEARALLLDAILTRLDELYSGCNVTFTYTQPTGSFGSTSSFLYASFGYSQICLGGSFDGGSSSVLGVAQFDPNNTRQNNNCLLENGTSPRLGVFLHTIADTGFRSSNASAFRQLFDNLAPALGGAAIGTVANDLSRLLGTTTDTRSAVIDAAIEDLARYIAVVLAHECGHSHGLVQNGAMPTGLYGNDTTNFPGSSDGHIRTASLFPSSSINVMAPQLTYTNATSQNTAFNSLNLAYLREQVFYGN